MTNERNFEELEVGCYYLDGSGRLNGPMHEKDYDAIYCIENQWGHTYTKQGNYTEKGYPKENLITKVNVTITPVEQPKPRKFKIGDRVKVIYGLPKDILIVNKINPDNTYRLESDQENWGLDTVEENHIQLAEPEIELLVGAICELENGKIRTIAAFNLKDEDNNEDCFSDGFRFYNKNGKILESNRYDKEEEEKKGSKIKKILNKKTY